MKYTIEGFSQSELIRHGLDVRDATFLDWFSDFQQTGQMQTLIEDGVTYYWIEYSYVSKQLPILRLLSADSVRHYLLRLNKSGVLHKKTAANGRGRGARAYYCIDSAIWTDLTTKRDQRDTQSGGHGDQRDGDHGSQIDQRDDEYGGQRDQGDAGHVETGDQRDGDHAQIPSSDDSPNRGRDSSATTSACENKRDGIDPIVGIQDYIRRYAPTFYLSDPGMRLQIERFSRDFGSDLLREVTREYVKDKEPDKILRFFNNDFNEYLAKARKRAYKDEQEGNCMKCADCGKKLHPQAALEWDGEILCYEHARIRRSVEIQEREKGKAS